MYPKKYILPIIIALFAISCRNSAPPVPYIRSAYLPEQTGDTFYYKGETKYHVHRPKEYFDTIYTNILRIARISNDSFSIYFKEINYRLFESVEELPQPRIDIYYPIETFKIGKDSLHENEYRDDGGTLVIRVLFNSIDSIRFTIQSSIYSMGRDARWTFTGKKVK